MYKALIISLILVPLVFVSGQKSEFFPTDLTIQPFTANFIEPKIGLLIKVSENDLRLDIGATRDLYRTRLNENTTLSFGADFFTYTKIRGENDFKFPVEAVDYLFGINSGYLVKDGSSEYGFRFRFSHISAHLVDGRYDNKTDLWLEGRKPFVYSREFIEVFPFYRYKEFRFYGGITYIYHTQPDDIKPWILQGGGEYYMKTGSGLFNPFIAYDFKLGYTNAYTPTHNIMAGVKIGHSSSAGFTVYLGYFNGKNVHGLLYESDEEYISTGFNIDL